MRKLIADIFKSSNGDCSNNGISNNFDQVICYWLDATETINDIKYIEPNAVLFITKATNFSQNSYSYFEPIHEIYAGTRYMMGGCFVYSSHNCFADWCSTDKPIQLHDRLEMH